MEVLIGLICSLLAFYVIVNLFIQYTEVNLFRIKQFIAYALGICLCIMPFVITTEEWVFKIFALAFASYFFIESFISRDDFFALMEVFDESEEGQEAQEEQGENKKK